MSRGRLKPEDQLSIQSNYRFLKEQLEALDLVDYLFEVAVLTIDNKETIRKETNRSERNEILLNILLNSGPENAFNLFLRSLENHYGFVLEKLKRTAKSFVKENSFKDQIKNIKDELARSDAELEKLKQENEKITEEKVRINADLEKLKQENGKFREEKVMSDEKLDKLKQENEKLRQEKDIDLVLIGKTGNGKSRTGNTILQKEVFEHKDSSSSVTQDVQHGYVHYGNRRIKVVDCPGIEDTANIDDVEETTRYLIEKMRDAVTQHPDGYHAFLLVVRCGGRFTKEDKCIISKLKSIFGEGIISQFSILLMTHGDIFHSRNRHKNFKQWCSEQTGVLKDLMEECGNRVILFDNETNDKRKIDEQMKKMIQTIDNLQSLGMRYNHDYFQRALKNREYLLIAVKEPRILAETSKEFTIISGELEKLENDYSDECIENLNRLHNRTLKIECNVQTEDNNTGALEKALEVIDCLSKMIASRLQVTMAVREKESDLKEERESLLKLHEKEMNNLLKTFEQKKRKM